MGGSEEREGYLGYITSYFLSKRPQLCFVLKFKYMTLLLMICHSFCSAKYYYKNSCHVLFYEVLLLPFNYINSLTFGQSSAISLIPVKSIMTLYSNNNTIMTWFTELFDSPIAIGV